MTSVFRTVLSVFLHLIFSNTSQGRTKGGCIYVRLKSSSFLAIWVKGYSILLAGIMFPVMGQSDLWIPGVSIFLWG